MTHLKTISKGPNTRTHYCDNAVFILAEPEVISELSFKTDIVFNV